MTEVRAATAGAVGAAVALAATEMASGVTRRVPSLVAAVGDVVVDHAPFAIVEGAIGLFGTNDKTALVVGTVTIALALGALLGMATLRHPGAAAAGFAGFGLLGAWAATRQPGTSAPLSTLSAATATAAGLAVVTGLHWLADRSRHPRPPSTPDDSSAGRRAFLAAAAAGAAMAASGAALGGRLRRRLAVEGARSEVVLPRPARRDPDISPAALGGVAGLTPLVTPNRRFYRIDTAILLPQVDPEGWSLKVTGRVERPLELSFDDLLGRPMVEEWVTLACVSNEVGGTLVGNALWLGVPLADLLAEARPHADATQVVGRSVDGFTAGFPTAAATDDRPALVAVGMNGEPLPIAHGFPARLVVSGLYGYVSATKWLTEIELTRFDDFDGYWVPRGWSKEAPVKTQSRIDVPRRGQLLPSGENVVAGVAWAPHRGISSVEVQIDDGRWRPAELSGDTPVDTWRQWRLRWDAPEGDHLLRVRATDGRGETQTAAVRPPAPDGATGLHAIRVRVEPGIKV